MEKEMDETCSDCGKYNCTSMYECEKRKEKIESVSQYVNRRIQAVQKILMETCEPKLELDGITAYSVALEILNKLDEIK